MEIEKLYKNEKVIYCQSPMEWRQWLENNHDKENAVFIAIFHKGSAIESVTYLEALDEALCFGWIDSKINKRDAQSHYQYFAKRNPKSNWSKVNKEKVAKLIEQGKMEKAGFASIEIARISGTWDALNDVDNLVLPEDLSSELIKYDKALDNFNQFPNSVKRGILEWIFNAKKAGTRYNRIHHTAILAKDNIRANQFVKK